MDVETKQRLIAYLQQFVTQNRLNKINTIVQERTRYVTSVLEDPYHPHNISAVLRTIECLGMQDVHVIEERNPYTITNGVAKGSGKWLDVHRYGDVEKDNTRACLASLKQQGYRLVATAPSEHAYTPHDLPIDNKLALLFGTELVGLTNVSFEYADMLISIPMYGFTESFNISVSTAICCHTVMQRVRNSDYNWRLSFEEQLDVKLSWLRRTIERSASLEQAFFAQ